MLLCVEGAGSEAMYLGRVLMVLVRASRDLTENGLELIAVRARQITPYGKPRMKDTEGDEQEDDWADQKCIGHEHDEMSAHGLWTKLKEMYREKTYQNKALLRRLVLKLQRRTIVAEQTSEFQRATGKGQKEEAREEVSRMRRDKKNCPRNKAQDQSSEAAATTAMMAVDESDVLLAASADEKSDWISNSGIAYHLCRDREEKLQEKEDWKAIPIEGECPDRRAAVRHRSSVEQEHKEMLWDTCESLAKHEKVQPVQDVHEEAQRKETESRHNDRRDVAEMSLFRSRSVAVISPVVHTREERWSHDDLQSDILCRAPRWGGAGHLSEKVQALRFGSAFTSMEVELPVDEGNVSRILSCRFYKRAGSEVVGKDNLKTTDYPPMGWRGRLEGAERRRRLRRSLPPSSMVKNGGTNELSHELIFSALRPIN
ncbi:hypothetical protein Acr_14g0002580 [Actinidia rufa]|uniref:Uncharacterized protein n=1 Tax=Actinidia rufa TaxID=165716 RepID=A0A7J0FPH3_9ERIC|nr:hypothetical protein Acr_14g0002580 [Actinidia rufa]